MNSDFDEPDTYDIDDLWGGPTIEYRPLSEAADRFIDDCRNLGRRVHTGLEDFDRAMRGVGPGELCVINGFAHNGKTVVGLQVLEKNRDRIGLLFTPDETREMVLVKLAGLRTGVPADELERRINQNDHDAVQSVLEAAKDFAKLAVYDEYVGLHDMDTAWDQVSETVGEPEFVFFDYASQLAGEGDPASKLQDLKGWGKRHKVPLFVMHQSSKTKGAGGKAVDIESGTHGGHDTATFMIGVRRKKNWIMAQISDLEEKLQVTTNPQQESRYLARVQDLRGMIEDHRDTITLNLPKNKRPPSRPVDEVDYKLDADTGRITKIVPGAPTVPEEKVALFHTQGSETVVELLNRHREGRKT